MPIQEKVFEKIMPEVPEYDEAILPGFWHGVEKSAETYTKITSAKTITIKLN